MMSAALPESVVHDLVPVCLPLNGELMLALVPVRLLVFIAPDTAAA